MNVTGIVRDRSDNQPMIGARVFVSDFFGNIIDNLGTISDSDGKYSLNIPLEKVSGNYITASYSGYTPKTLKINPNFRMYNFELSDKVQLEDEFEVIATSPKTECEQKGGVYDSVNRKCVFISNKPKIKAGEGVKKRLIIGGIILLLATVSGIIIYKKIKK